MSVTLQARLEGSMLVIDGEQEAAIDATIALSATLPGIGADPIFVAGELRERAVENQSARPAQIRKLETIIRRAQHAINAYHAGDAS